MRAADVLQKSLRMSLPQVHGHRWTALWVAVTALVAQGKLTQAGLAKAAAGTSSTKHRIKRLWRLCRNIWLQKEIIPIFGAVSAWVLRSKSRPVILVDWTSVTKGLEYHAITASTPCSGRALLLYTEIHPEKRLQNPRVEKQFLKNLKSVLPLGVRPIIVTDGGFRTPWFDQVKELGWDYVGRLRNRNLYYCKKTDAWKPIKDLWIRASKKAMDLGAQLLTRSNPREVRMVLIKEKKPPRRRRRPMPKRQRPTNRRGPNKQSKTRQSISQARARATEPWLLVTSVVNQPATRIVSLYKTRMQTEETYRDVKNSRLGWGLDQSQIRRPERILVLLLIAALTSLVVLAVGVAAEQAELHWRHQGNSLKKRRVRSLFALGCLLATLRDTEPLTVDQVRQGFKKLHSIVAEHGLQT